MINGINNSYIGNNPFQSQLNSGKTDSGLSYREQEILAEMQDKVLSELGIPVELNLGQQSESGLSIAVIGLSGYDKNGSQKSFLITPDILKEMAEDENKYREWMSWAQEKIQDQKEKVSWLQNNVKEAEEERKDYRMRVNMMSAFDFWNESKGNTQPIQGQAMQQMVDRYEQMLLFQ